MGLPRTPMALHLLEEALCKNHGDLLEACREVGCKLQHVTAWKNADPEVAERIKHAQMLGWASLESAAYERAVKGVDRGVYYQGELVGTEKVYSDTLLSQMLKARVPGYGESTMQGGMTVNVAILPRAATYDEWVVQREKMLSGDPERSISGPSSPAGVVLDGQARQIERPKALSGLPDVL